MDLEDVERIIHSIKQGDQDAILAQLQKFNDEVLGLQPRDCVFRPAPHTVAAWCEHYPAAHSMSSGLLFSLQFYLIYFLGSIPCAFSSTQKRERKGR